MKRATRSFLGDFLENSAALGTTLIFLGAACLFYGVYILVNWEEASKKFVRPFTKKKFMLMYSSVSLFVIGAGILQFVID